MQGGSFHSDGHHDYALVCAYNVVSRIAPPMPQRTLGYGLVDGLEECGYAVVPQPVGGFRFTRTGRIALSTVASSFIGVVEDAKVGSRSEAACLPTKNVSFARDPELVQQEKPTRVTRAVDRPRGIFVEKP